MVVPVALFNSMRRDCARLQCRGVGGSLPLDPARLGSREHPLPGASPCCEKVGRPPSDADGGDGGRVCAAKRNTPPPRSAIERCFCPPAHIRPRGLRPRTPLAHSQARRDWVTGEHPLPGSLRCACCKIWGLGGVGAHGHAPLQLSLCQR
jgi:hypothetical protein